MGLSLLWIWAIGSRRGGFVSSRADINKAVAVARSVQGVESVKNDMRLKGQP